MWKEALNILPEVQRRQVEELKLPSPPEELRLRLGMPPTVVCARETLCATGQAVTAEALRACLERATAYSVYAQELSHGFVTIRGGHRLGICGTAVYRDGKLSAIRDLTSLNLRIARTIDGCAAPLADYLWMHPRSTLLIGPPARGKTTFLRDCIRQMSDRFGWRVCVVDERMELSGVTAPGKNTDVLRAAKKAEGIEMLLRAMNPQWIAVDEITAEQDVEAITRASYCGVRFLATAHAADADDLRRRPVYRSLMRAAVFENLVTILPDRTLKTERIPGDA